MQADLSRRPTVGGVLAAGVGLALFAYFLHRAGVGEVLGGIRRVGLVFIVVLALGGVRFLIRSAAWIQCLDGPHRLTLSHVFRAVVVGDSLSNLTPLNIIVGEPAKGMFLREREPLNRTLPALAVENLFYTLSAMLIIAGGLVVVVLMFQTTAQLWVTTTVMVSAMMLIVATVHLVIWNRWSAGSGTLNWLRDRGVAPHFLGRLSAKVSSVEHHIQALYPRDRRKLVPLGLLHLTFHLVSILEIFVVLSVVADQPPTVLHAFVFDSTNRFISFAFRFVPLRVGVDEAGSGIFADLLAFGTATGVTLAIVRKGRMLVWIAVGIVILVRRGLSVRQALESAAGKVAVVVMARSAVAGRPPKTRLAQVIPDDDTRRRLYSAFVDDTITTCRSVPGASLRVAYTPDGDAAEFRQLGVADDELIAQDGSDLGARERSVFTALFSAGFTKVVMIGSDLPTIPVFHIRDAIRQVEAGNVVLGPAEDGGYYLIALEGGSAEQNGVPDLFSDVRWSTPHAFDDTRAAAERLGLQVELVPTWYDVDDETGLTRLRAELDHRSARKRAPSTARELRRIFDPRAAQAQ